MIIMLVNVGVKRLDSGRVQIFVAKPQYDPNPVQTYASTEKIRVVLLAFGIEEEIVKTHLELLPKLNANEPLTFPPREIPQDVLWAHGFKL